MGLSLAGGIGRGSSIRCRGAYGVCIRVLVAYDNCVFFRHLLLFILLSLDQVLKLYVYAEDAHYLFASIPDGG